MRKVADIDTCEPVFFLDEALPGSKPLREWGDSAALEQTGSSSEPDAYVLSRLEACAHEYSESTDSTPQREEGPSRAATTIFDIDSGMEWNDPVMIDGEAQSIFRSVDSPSVVAKEP